MIRESMAPGADATMNFYSTHYRSGEEIQRGIRLLGWETGTRPIRLGFFGSSRGMGLYKRRSW